jgi:hypothetical protein
MRLWCPAIVDYLYRKRKEYKRKIGRVRKPRRKRKR